MGKRRRLVHVLPEVHRINRAGWLRAAVLGANDGIISTSSLILGVAAAQTSHQAILLTGVAGLAAGALSMAAGEYVSVSTQSDTERADLKREKLELASNIESERQELADIYIGRGLEPLLAREVAEQLMEKDALGAHARDELGITSRQAAKPIQAAVASAGAFAVGAALPLLMVFIGSAENLSALVSSASLVFLILLGMLAAKIGGSNIWLGALRVGFWGALAMAVTSIIGSFFQVPL